MGLFTPFTIPKKENCDLCRIKNNKKKAAENNLLDNLFKNLYRKRFDFLPTDLQLSGIGLWFED